MNIDFKKIKNISTETLMNLSAVIDKMEISEQLRNMNIDTGNEKADNEELGKELIILLISKLYKAKEEVYDLVASYKGISKEEAMKADVISIIKELLGIDGVTDFLS